MAASSFGIDADSVRRHHFANFDAFSAGGRPSLTTVTEVITEEAARMAGRLNLANIDATTGITVSSDAYNLCRRILRLQVAARLARDIPGTDSDIAKGWRDEVQAFFDMVDVKGDEYLGNGATAFGTSEPDGPTDFISELSLDVGDDSEASDVIPVLRRKDDL